MIDLDEAPLTPTRHQRVAVAKIVADPYLFLCDEMGMGKTKSVLDSAQVLYRRGEIDRVIVIAPASVVPVWIDPDLGQISAHAWPTVPITVTHYHARARAWHYGPQSYTPLQIIASNYEYIRTGMRARSNSTGSTNARACPKREIRSSPRMKQ